MKTKNLQPCLWLPRTFCILFASFFLTTHCGLLAQSDPPFELRNGSDSTTKELWIGTSAQPVNDVYGIEILFDGDFSEILTSEISLDLDTGWFCPGNAGSSYSWELNGDSSEATLRIWDPDSTLCSGYGIFLEMHRATGLGNIVIVDVNKRLDKHPLNFLRLEGAMLQVYPNPIAPGAVWQVTGPQNGQVLELYGGDGRLLKRITCSGSPVQIRPPASGQFMLLWRSAKTGALLGNTLLLAQ